MKVVDNVARAFAPAGVGNIGVGFDLLGHSIDGPRDVARVRRVAAPGVRITAITGDAAGADAIPLEVERNTAGQALASLHAALGLKSEEHTSELQSLMRLSYAVFCLNKNNNTQKTI